MSGSPNRMFLLAGLPGGLSGMPQALSALQSGQEMLLGMPSTDILLAAAQDIINVQDMIKLSTPLSPSMLMPAKQEPPSSAGSSESTDLNRPFQPVPLCSICGADSTGIHFGVEACAACSAFFRRTVVLAKNYSCNKDGKCIVLKDAVGAQRCRACRFKKCIAVGMDRNSVQHRRDAIGKISVVKRELSPPEDISEVLAVNGASPRPEKSPRLGRSVLEEFIFRHEHLLKQRKLFYSSESLTDTFDDTRSIHTDPVELKDFGECMFQLWRIEPRLCADYVSTNAYLAHLPPKEKATLFKNFMLKFQAVEEPYLTWKYGGIEKEWWIMPNRTYVDFNHADHYFDSAVMKALNLDKATALKLFLPSFKHAMELVGGQMGAINLSYTEMVALSAMVLLDPTIEGLEETTKETIARARDQLFKDLLAFYETDDTVDYPEVRIGNVVFIISAVRVHALRTSENMQMLKLFDIVPRDALFDEICNLA